MIVATVATVAERIFAVVCLVSLLAAATWVILKKEEDWGIDKFES